MISLKTNKISIRFVTILISTLLLLFTVEAKADLADDLIKKHKLDPKNNPKDQCILMTEISRIIRGPGDDDFIETKKYGSSESQIFRKQTKGNEKRSSPCLQNICIAGIEIIGDKRGIDKYDVPWMIYQKKPFKALGLDIGNYTVYDYYDEQRKTIESTYYLVGRSNKNKKTVFVQSDKISSEKNVSYIKTQGCHIEEYNVVNDSFLPTRKNHE